MVQLLLRRAKRHRWTVALLAAASGVLLSAASALPPARPHEEARTAWEMSLDGGRSLTWERSFQSESEVKPNRGFWNKVLDFVAGAPDYRFLVRPYSVVVDSKGRVILSDPGVRGVHIFDFVERKYKFIQHESTKTGSMISPQCVAVDAQDNIYVTDSEAGVIFVFAPSGKFLRSIGSLKGGEGYFKRPTGIAVNSADKKIYVTDTLRDEIFVLDLDGTIVQTIGKEGSGEGEFNDPTELRLDGNNLIVVDAMNFRIQVLDLSGRFQFAIGKIGDSAGAIFRPKATAVDSEGDIYVVDALWGLVQVFNRESQLLYYFGTKGTRAGEFQLPSGLFIDRADRVYVVDSFNRRVQVFHYSGVRRESQEAGQ